MGIYSTHVSPRRFLQLAGTLLAVVAIVGFLRPDLAGDFWRFDPLENWTRLLLGMAMIVLAPVPPPALPRAFAALVGVAMLALGVTGFLVAARPSPNFFGLVNLESPVDNVFHLILGAWGVLAAIVNRRVEKA